MDCSTNHQTSSSSPDSSSSAVDKALQLIQSDDASLKFEATKEIRRLIITSPSFKRQLSGLIELLVSMLRLDLPESHLESALQALVALAFKDKKNKIKIVEAGALKPIISFLQSQSLKLQESATAFLLVLSTPTINKPIIGSSGAIPLLIKILGNKSQLAKMNAIEALVELIEDPNNLNIILGTNLIPYVVNLLKYCAKSSTLAKMCRALIGTLIGFDEGRTALTSEESGILAVVEVFKFGPTQSQEHALGVLLTKCQIDRFKYTEVFLREGIIPELLKLAFEGTPKSKLKAHVLLLLLRDSPYSQRVPRVTVYHVNDNGEWVEQGIRYITIDYLKESKRLCVLVIAEVFLESLLHNINPDDVYGWPQDEVIQWRDSKKYTYSVLRFHETADFSYIWDHICSVQTNSHFNTVNTSILRRIGGSIRERNNTNSNVSSYQKVTLEWIFVIANFILELTSALFDQLSSVQKPKYALIAMVMSFVGILVCVVELIYKGQKEKVMWRSRSRGKGKISWFYYGSQIDKRFGTFADIVGLGCAIFQFIVTTINYSFICHNSNVPIKISVWPIIYTFGVLFSKFSENPKNSLHRD